MQYQRSVKCHWALISLSAILIWIHPWLPRANKAFKPHRALTVQRHQPSRLLPQLKWAGPRSPVPSEDSKHHRRESHPLMPRCNTVTSHTVPERSDPLERVTEVVKEAPLLMPVATQGRVSSLSERCDSLIRHWLLYWGVWWWDMRASGAVQRKELIDVSPLRADADILQEKVHLAAEILMSGGAATMINRGNQEHFDVWTLQPLIKMALKGVLKVTSAALVVVCVPGHVESYLHTHVYRALRYVFQFRVSALCKPPCGHCCTAGC